MVNEREKQLKSLTRILHGESGALMDESSVQELDQQLRSIQAEVQQLESRVSEESSKNDGQLGFVRDRYNAAEKKKEKLVEQLDEHNNEVKEVEDDLRRLNNDLRLFHQTQAAANETAPNRPKTEAQHKAYMAELAAKTASYKALKGELEYEKEENKVLMNTEVKLKGQMKSSTEANTELEKSKGLSGYTATEENLAQISSLKASIDANKGETLDEISNLVEKINNSLKDRKNKLAPMIKELRTVRQSFEEIENVYREKKANYLGMKLGYESERVKLETDVKEVTAALQEEESNFHFNHGLMNLAQVRVKMLQQESRYQNNEEKFPIREYRTYKDYYEKEIQREEMKAKQLRNEKKYLSEKNGK